MESRNDRPVGKGLRATNGPETSPTRAVRIRSAAGAGKVQDGPRDGNFPGIFIIRSSGRSGKVSHFQRCLWSPKGQPGARCRAALDPCCGGRHLGRTSPDRVHILIPEYRPRERPGCGQIASQRILTLSKRARIAAEAGCAFAGQSARAMPSGRGAGLTFEKAGAWPNIVSGPSRDVRMACLRP
jgi:hypothetical protein